MEGIEGYRPYLFTFRAEYNKKIEEYINQSDVEFNQKQKESKLRARLSGYGYEDRWMRATFDENNVKEAILIVEGG